MTGRGGRFGIPPQDKFSFFAGVTAIFTGGDMYPHPLPLLCTLDVSLNIAKT